MPTAAELAALNNAVADAQKKIEGLKAALANAEEELILADKAWCKALEEHRAARRGA